MMKKFTRVSLIAPLLAMALVIPALAEVTNGNDNASNANTTVNANTSTNSNEAKKEEMEKKREEAKQKAEAKKKEAEQKREEAKKRAEALRKDRLALVDGACMSTAVDKRDTAMLASTDATATAVKTALTTRKDALKAAWLLTEGRTPAIKAVWKAYNTSVLKARKDLRTSRQAAWKTFKTEARLCGQNALSADASGEGMDAKL